MIALAALSFVRNRPHTITNVSGFARPREDYHDTVYRQDAMRTLGGRPTACHVANARV